MPSHARIENVLCFVARFYLWCTAAPSSPHTKTFRVSPFIKPSEVSIWLSLDHLPFYDKQTSSTCHKMFLVLHIYICLCIFNGDAINIFRWVKFIWPSMQTPNQPNVKLMISKIKQNYQVWLVYKTIVPRPRDCCSTWLNFIYLFLTWQGSYTIKLTDEKDTVIRGGIVLFGIKLCNQ